MMRAVIDQFNMIDFANSLWAVTNAHIQLFSSKKIWKFHDISLFEFIFRDLFGAAHR